MQKSVANRNAFTFMAYYIEDNISIILRRSYRLNRPFRFSYRIRYLSRFRC